MNKPKAPEGYEWVPTEGFFTPHEIFSESEVYDFINYAVKKGLHPVTMIPTPYILCKKVNNET